MIHLNLNTPITILDVNDPNTSSKRQKLPDRIKCKANYVLCTRNTFYILRHK